MNRPTSPLALAVLVLLFEKPMHPYEMASTMRARGKEKSIKLRYGSLYTVIDSLEAAALIVPTETVRDGARPERTVYAITPAGRAEMNDWLREWIARPEKEYLRFEAGLSLLPALPPDHVIDLLRDRLARLDPLIAEVDAELTTGAAQEVPQLFLIESEYQRALLLAERQFVIGLITQMEAGTLGGLDLWRGWHQQRAAAEKTASTTGPA